MRVSSLIHHSENNFVGAGMHTTTFSPVCHLLVPAHPHGANRLVMQQQRKRGMPRAVPASFLCRAMDANTPSMHSDVPSHPKKSRNMLQVSGSIGLATTFSKALGLLREILLAAVFGVGPVMTAFSYSSMIPGFFMAVLGGINGPLQVTTLAFLSKVEETEGRVLAGKILTAIALVCGSLALAIYLFSGAIIDAIAPGLLTGVSSNDLITRNLAILQLKIMAPCALLAGLIGVGFGTLSAAGIYEVLSLSPIISSMFMIAAVFVHMTLLNYGKNASTDLTKGAISLALGVTAGAAGQWIWQAKAHHDIGLDFAPFQTVNPFKDTDLQEILMALLPAIVGSGMLQLATLTDLYFASFIPGAAAGLGYAYLLVMAPIGILSSTILLPMSSMFARLTEPSDRTELKNRVSEGLLALLAATLPFTAVVFSLSRPLVEVALQRSAFDASASALVSSLVACYVAGSFASLARDLLTQLFYALGDGHIPCYITMAAVLSNALLDWKLVHIGPVGLVLATSLVNGISVVALLMFLSIKLHGLPFRQWAYSSSKMLGGSIISGIVTKVVYNSLIGVFSKIRALQILRVFSLLLASFMGVTTFFVILHAVGNTELQSVIKLSKRQLSRYPEV